MWDFILWMLMISLLVPQFVYMILRGRFMKMFMFMIMGMQMRMSMLLRAMDVAVGMEKIFDNLPVLFIHFSLVKHIMKQLMGPNCKGKIKAMRLKERTVIKYLRCRAVCRYLTVTQKQTTAADLKGNIKVMGT
jgi:hypothetical protein